MAEVVNNGVSSLVRLDDVGVRGWNRVARVFVDLAGGDDRNDGLTASSQLRSISEYQRRLGTQAIDGAVTPVVVVSISGDSVESFRLSPRLANHALLLVAGTRTNLAGVSGMLTTFQARNAATKTQCEFSFSGLSSTWTAAGAVGAFVALPSLGNVSAVVGKDLGSKTALSSGPMDLDSGEPVSGGAVQFQGYRPTRVASNLIEISPEGLGVLLFSDMELGDLSDLHCVTVYGSAQTTFLGCRVIGVDNFATTATSVYGCSVVGWRDYGRGLHRGSVHDSVGGAILRVHEGGTANVVDSVLFLGVVSVDCGGALTIEGDASSYGAFQGIVNAGNLRVDGSFWVKNAALGGNVLECLGGSVASYASAARLGATGTLPTSAFVVPGASGNTLPQVSTANMAGIVPLRLPGLFAPGFAAVGGDAPARRVDVFRHRVRRALEARAALVSR